MRGTPSYLALVSSLLLVACDPGLEETTGRPHPGGSSSGGGSSSSSGGTSSSSSGSTSSSSGGSTSSSSSGSASSSSSGSTSSSSSGSASSSSSGSASSSSSGSASSSSSGSTSSSSSGGASSSSSGASSSSSGAAHVKFVGNITTRGQVRNDFAKYWNQITPENEGKWDSVEHTQGRYNWGPLDAIYKYANDNNIIFKQHTFVWGGQQPPWVKSSDVKASVRAWMKAFCERYPKTKIIDVVNEPPPHTRPDYADGMGGDGATGYDWIVNAFKWAREFCPNAILLLNDYNNIEYGNDTTNTINIVKKIKAAGAPVDGVGCQAHATSGISADNLKRALDKIATETGLPVYVTEFDLAIADDNQQKAKMQEHMTMFMNNPNVKGVTLWGYVVGATWVNNSGLIQDNGTFRPSMTWLMGFLMR
jgi:endo-1,4-beta-xylanase